MSAKQPEIKFSPFEALLIGEKNRVLKRQPMKNTIFVTRLNQKNRTINLRALFGLEKNIANSKTNDDIFKMPRNVHEFLNNKKHSYENKTVKQNEEEDKLCKHGSKGHKMFVKSYNSVKPKYKKPKKKSNKVNFREKCNRNGNEKVVNKVEDAPKSHSTIKTYNLTKGYSGIPKVVLRDIQKDLSSVKGYELQCKNGRFTCETKHESSQSKEDSKSKQEYVSSYVCEFVTDNNKHIFNNDSDIENEHLKKFPTSDVIENILGASKWHEEFDLSSPDTLLDCYIELFKNNYYCLEDFEFPKSPQIGISDFDVNENLFDIIYENFPKSFKFGSKDSSHDFIDSLINTSIIKPINDLEINITEEELEQNEKIKVSCGTQTSSMDLPKSIDLSSCYHLESLRNEYVATSDGFVAIQNHLITDENFGSLFINNSNHPDKNDLLMASLMKPLLHNSWVRSIQNF